MTAKKHSRGLWIDGRVVSTDVERPTKPARVLTMLVLALLLVDGLLAVALPEPDRQAYKALATPADVREVLAQAAEAEHPWLLVGDSVLAGDVMQGHVEQWQTQRVIDYLRTEGAPEHRASFHQVALNGLLPVDIARIVAELNRTDPSGRVSVLIELNPRYWSRHYAAQTECTRDWLCELGVPLMRTGVLDWRSLVQGTLSEARRWLLAHTPIVRHRERFGAELAPETTLMPPPQSEAPDRLSALARVTEHYRDSDMRRGSRQIRALRSAVNQLRESGRRATFFTTPIEDSFLDQATPAVAYGELIASLSSIIDRADDTRVSLINLDHPSFTKPVFIDHCHLRPAGNRRLAINLLHELNQGLVRVPERTEMAHPEGVDATLVARIGRGYSDGASWQALLNKPGGIAVDPGRRRVVIADTGSNTLRELRGNMQTLRRIAGAGEDDDKRPGADGRAKKVILRGPRTPWFFRDRVYFSDHHRRELRYLDGGHVLTEFCLEGPCWKRVFSIRSTDNALFVLDDRARVLQFDPVEHRTSVVVTADGALTIRAFDVTADGRVFVVDGRNRIWEAALGRPAHIGEEPEGATLLFANVASKTLPDKKRNYFPFGYHEVRLRDVKDIQYVERYGGLLVQDDVRGKKKAKGVTERIHLRFFDLHNERIYPWLRPLAFGGGHILTNKSSGSLVTRFHLGTMALDQRTASLFYLERDRSRLVRMSDGLLGAALVGNTNSKRDFSGTREFFGTASGDAVLANLQPDQYLDTRWDRLEREGPYLGVIVGSSMLGASDMVGMYSLGRVLERRLQDALGYRDRTRLDLIVRSIPAVSARKAADTIKRLVESSAVPDVILVEIRGSRGFFGKLETKEAVVKQLQRMRESAERAGALLVLLDVTSLVSSRRDGLRTGDPEVEERMQLIRDSGLQIIDPGDLLLDDHWVVSPWGSPPGWFHHASPWAIEATGARFADALYPYIRDHLRGRQPARRGELLEASTDEALGPTFEEFAVDWSVLPVVHNGEMQRSYEARKIDIFVDVANVDTQSLPLAALACAHSALTQDPVSGRATELHIRLAIFSNYDEYGQGVLEGADIRYERTLDRDGLRDLINEVFAAAPR